MPDSLKRLTDAELSTANLVVLSAAALGGVSDQRPPEGVLPEIIFEYDLPGSEPKQRCCFCPSRTPHRKGFRVRFNEHEYLVGSTCGPSHLGLEFTVAKSGHSNLKSRQQALHRLQRARARTGLLLEWADRILFGQALRDVEAESEKFRKASPDAFFRLRHVATGLGTFTETVRVRDLAREASRQDNEADRTKAPQPLFKEDEVALGRLTGRALLLADGLRDTVLKLKVAAQGIATLADRATDDYTTSAINQRAGDFERSIDAAKEVGASLERAEQFFSPTNLDRLARWAPTKTVDRLRTGDGVLSVKAKGGGKFVTLSLPELIVPPFPPID